METKHNADCHRVFKNYDLKCPRCLELKNGAKPREGWNDFKNKQNAIRLNSIKNHDCAKAGCMAICTFGDW